MRMTSAGGRSPPPPSNTIFLACCNTCLATRIRPPRPTLGPPMTNQEPLPATFAGQLPFIPTSACITPGLICATKSVEADHVAGGRRKHEQAAIVRYTPPKDSLGAGPGNAEQNRFRGSASFSGGGRYSRTPGIVFGQPALQRDALCIVAIYLFLG